MKKKFVGVDISKDWLDYSTCNSEVMKKTAAVRIDNDVPGIISMLDELCKTCNKESLWFCFEHTGYYGLLLSSILQARGYNWTAVSALEVKKSIGIARGKTDKVDAERLADYAATHSHKLTKSELPSKELMQIKGLLAHRTQLVKIKVMLTNSLKSYKIADEVVDLSFIYNDLIAKVESLKKDIKAIELKIKDLIKQNDRLAGNYDLVNSVVGIGPVIASVLIVYTNNFTTFANPRKFNCFAGIAPFEESSGISIKSARTSNYKHKHIKKLLYSGANSAVMNDPQLKKYYQRKIAQGKDHQSIMNAITCKLVARAFATVKRQTPYVILVN